MRLNHPVVSGSLLLVECNNNVLPVYFTASLQDRVLIESHRWRAFGTDIVTSIPSGSLEVKATLDSVLFGCSAKTTLPKRNKNPLDFTRENVTLNGHRKTVFINKGVISYLPLPNAQTVIVDTAVVPELERYTWSSMTYRGQPMICTRYWDGAKKKVYRAQLPRLIMNCNRGPLVVRFKNGDRLDCRKENLTVEHKRPKTGVRE